MDVQKVRIKAWTMHLLSMILHVCIQLIKVEAEVDWTGRASLLSFHDAVKLCDSFTNDNT